MNIVSLEPLGVNETVINAMKEEFSKRGHDLTIYGDRTVDENVLATRAKDADVVIVTNIPLSSTFIENVKNLRMIAVAFTGYDHIDLEACREKKITVCNAAGYSTHAVSELAIALMLDVLRKITANDSKTRKQKGREGFLGRELFGKTVGIIGTGAIGTQTARILKIFGCELIGFSRTEKQAFKDLGGRYLTLDEVLQESDIVSLHLPLNKVTRQIIDAPKIALMKPTGVLINTARGGLVDSDALSKALDERRIAGAGIDVYENEPPINSKHPLMGVPNTVLVPHLGYATREAMLIRADIVKQNILKWLKGEPQNVVT
ncbi:MAG: hydroxyacid dehydrogenase [Bacteroidales bacterium]|nr:hydroxyacid dehydrogenase [Bacteroidales bacterium]